MKLFLSFLKSLSVIFLFSFAFYTVRFFVVYLSNFTMIPYYLRYWPTYALTSLITLFLYWRISAAEGASKTLKGEDPIPRVILPHVLSHLTFLLLAIPFRDYPVTSHAAFLLFGIATFPMYAVGNVFVGVLITVPVLLTAKCIAILYGHRLMLRAHPYLRTKKAGATERPARSWRDSLRSEENAENEKTE